MNETGIPDPLIYGALIANSLAESDFPSRTSLNETPLHVIYGLSMRSVNVGKKSWG